MTPLRHAADLCGALELIIHEGANVAAACYSTQNSCGLCLSVLRLEVLLWQKIPVWLFHVGEWNVWFALGLESTDHIVGAIVI